jgi:hypothetical protein
MSNSHAGGEPATADNAVEPTCVDDSSPTTSGVRSIVKRAVLIGSGGLIAAGCFVAGWWFGASSRTDAPLGSPDVQKCGAFSAIDTLVHESMRQEPGPGQTPPRTYDLIGLASALNNARAEGISSPALDSAITAYVYALTNLGAVINHHEPVDDIESMYVVANTTGHTVTTLCQDSAITPPPPRSLHDSEGTAPCDTDAVAEPVRRFGGSPGGTAAPVR